MIHDYMIVLIFMYCAYQTTYIGLHVISFNLQAALQKIKF